MFDEPLKMSAATTSLQRPKEGPEAELGIDLFYKSLNNAPEFLTPDI